MDNQALTNLTYGVFLLSTKLENITNGCIIDTCIQVANEPAQVAFSVSNQTYTCELLKKSGVFTMSILNQDCTYETIRHFGYQSGREVKKFAELNVPTDGNGVPYLGWQTCAALCGKVVNRLDLGTHTLFVGEIAEAKVLNETTPLTYAEYQKRVKQQRQNVASQ